MRNAKEGVAMPHCPETVVQNIGMWYAASCSTNLPSLYPLHLYLCNSVRESWCV